MANTPPELQQLLSESVNRSRYQNPLFEAVTQMAYRGLPTYAREGTSLGQMGPAAPIAVPGAGGDGGVPDWLKMLGAGLGGAALNSLGPNGNALGALIDGIKKLFGHGQSRGVQGNKPYGGGALMGGGQEYPGFLGWDQNYSDPLGNPYLISDPGFWANWNGMPNDPSGGTGVGPGMQDYYGNGGSGDYYGGGGGAQPAEDYWGEE